MDRRRVLRLGPFGSLVVTNNDFLARTLIPDMFSDRWDQEDIRLHLNIMDAIKGSIRW